MSQTVNFDAFRLENEPKIQGYTSYSKIGVALSFLLHAEIFKPCAGAL